MRRGFPKACGEAILGLLTGVLPRWHLYSQSRVGGRDKLFGGKSKQMEHRPKVQGSASCGWAFCTASLMGKLERSRLSYSPQ